MIDAILDPFAIDTSFKGFKSSFPELDRVRMGLEMRLAPSNVSVGGLITNSALMFQFSTDNPVSFLQLGIATDMDTYENGQTPISLATIATSWNYYGD
tara:strand:+ start:607 stop:900 length:294 start_codon:yes stop_codon:yes gene_type:complete